MLKKIALIFSCFVPTAIWGNDFQHLHYLIQRANDIVHNRPICDSNPDKETLAHQCITEICSNAHFSTSIDEQINQIQAHRSNPSAEFDNQVKPLVQQLINKNFELFLSENEAQMREFDQLTQGGKQPQRPFSNAFEFYRSKFGDVEFEFAINPQTKQKESRVKPFDEQEELKSYPKNVADWIIDTTQFHFQLMDECEKKYLVSSFSLIKKYGNDFFQNPTKLAAELSQQVLFLEQRAKIVCSNKQIFKDQKDIDGCIYNIIGELSEKINKLDLVDEKDFFVLESKKETLCSIETFSNPKLAEKISHFPGTIQNFLTEESNPPQDFIKERIASHRLQINAAQIAQSDLTEVEHLFNRCLTSWNTGVQGYPETVNLEEFSMAVNSAKQKAKETVSKFYSNYSSRVLGSNIDSLIFLPPPSKQKFKQDFINAIKRKIFEINQSIESYQKGYYKDLLKYESDFEY